MLIVVSMPEAEALLVVVLDGEVHHLLPVLLVDKQGLESVQIESSLNFFWLGFLRFLFFLDLFLFFLRALCVFAVRLNML